MSTAALAVREALPGTSAVEPVMAEKICTKCLDAWPADDEFFRPQPRPGNPSRLGPWCRACEADYAHNKRAIAKLKGGSA